MKYDGIYDKARSRARYRAFDWEFEFCLAVATRFKQRGYQTEQEEICLPFFPGFVREKFEERFVAYHHRGGLY